MNAEVENVVPATVTIPPNLSLSAHNFADEEYAKTALYRIHSILSVLSQNIDLSNMDGVTLSHDYDKSLAELDRGYETNYVLTATRDVAIGVAMAPSVIRNGELKTHLVLNAHYVLNLLEEPGEETEYFWQALHLVAHECAHVEVTATFDQCFPNWLLRKSHSNILDNFRWQAILAAWDEYEVCWIVGSIGYDPTKGYLETFIGVLNKTRSDCYANIKNYRIHGDVGRIVAEVYGALANLIKYASYYLGAKHRISPNDAAIDPLREVPEFSWFEGFFAKIETAMKNLHKGYGKWSDQSGFEAIGDIFEEMAEDIGIFATRQTDGEIYFDIPFTPETMP